MTNLFLANNRLAINRLSPSFGSKLFFRLAQLPFLRALRLQDEFRTRQQVRLRITESYDSSIAHGSLGIESIALRARQQLRISDVGPRWQNSQRVLNFTSTHLDHT